MPETELAETESTDIESTGATDLAAVEPTIATIESPPPAPMPMRDVDPDPRVRLHQLAGELARSQNRRLLVEFLRLRRALF